MARTLIGYEETRRRLRLKLPPLARPAYVDPGVNRRTDTPGTVLFPQGVALDDTPFGHLEFGLRNEGINLAVIAAAFEHIEPVAIESRLAASPNSEYARRLGFLWEWLRPAHPLKEFHPAAAYIDLFPREEYIVAESGTRNPKYRVRDNALGNPRFCPTVRKTDHPGPGTLTRVIEQAKAIVESVSPLDYERATNYLYLSETRTSFAIERDTIDSSREGRFMDALRRADDPAPITEDYLAEIQRIVARHDFSRETNYRTRQNWLARNTSRVDYFPPPPSVLRDMISGWEAFANDTQRGIDPLTQITCASFGFVYLHPFMDGNGRIHRFLLHKLLARSGLVDRGLLIPVSAVIGKHEADYFKVLSAFSAPVTALWEYQVINDEPDITGTVHPAAYRYLDAGREIQFLAGLYELAVAEEMPRELRWLAGFDIARERIKAEIDLADRDLNALIRIIHRNADRMSNKKRGKDRFAYIDKPTLERIEKIVCESFATTDELDVKEPLKNSS